jgi:glutathione S-transferase
MLSVTMAVATRPRLYVLPGSHPCAAVEAALKMKGIDYDRVDLLPMSQLLIGPLRYGGATVPGMRLGGERLVGSRAIMRRLDEMAPEPPLVPAPGDPGYAGVLEAERWGDEVFQSVPRRLINAAFLRRASAMESYVGDAKLPLPRPLLRPAMPLTARMMAIRNKASDSAARADLAALPAQLDRIDAWIAEGLLGGDPPNAADLQIGSTIRLLMSIGDARALIEGPPARPAARLADYFMPLAGEVPAGTLPAEWLPSPTSSTAETPAS